MWWKILLVVYLVGAIPADIIIRKMVDFCRARSVHDDQEIDDQMRKNQALGFGGQMFAIVIWPWRLLIFAGISFMTWKERKRTQLELELGRLATEQQIADHEEGKPLLIAWHPDRPKLAFTVTASVDGYQSFVHFFAKDKVDDLLEKEPFFRDLVDEVRKMIPIATDTGPKLRLIQEKDKTGLTNMWFYGRTVQLANGHPINLNPMLLNLTADAPCSFLVVFEKPDDAELERVFGCNTKETGVTPYQITDSGLFFRTLGTYANDRPVRIVKNVKKTGDGQWSFDTICEISPSRAESQEPRPPAA